MEAHPDLAKGLLRDMEGRKKMQTSWKDITTKLNDMGPQKTSKQWQKVYDLTYLLCHDTISDLNIRFVRYSSFAVKCQKHHHSLN